MAIGIFVDFRNDKFKFLYKKILRNNKKLVFIGQKKHIEIIKKKIGDNNSKYYVFNNFVSNNSSLDQNIFFSYLINFFIFLKIFFF
mgnify:CR=1 FL=1